MEGTIEQGDFHIHDRIASQYAAVSGFHDTLLNRRDEFLRNGTADDFVFENNAAAAFPRFKRNHDMTILTVTTRLLGILKVDFRDSTRDRFAVSHARLANIRLDTKFTHHAIDDNVEMKFAHPGNDRLTSVFVGADAERGIFL